MEAPHRLILAKGLPSLRDAVLVAAEGNWGDLYFVTYDANSRDGIFHATTGFKAYPLPGGFLLVPLRPIGPEASFVFPNDVSLDPEIPPLPVRQVMAFAPPCWLAHCSEPDLLPRVPLPLGQAIALGSREANRSIEDGWSDPQSGGRWTISGRASLLFDASSLPPGRDAIVTLIGNAYDPPGQEPAHILLQANGHRVADWHVAPGFHTLLTARIPTADIGPAGNLRLTLVIPHPRSPILYEQNRDPRPLGLFVRTIEVAPVGGGD